MPTFSATPMVVALIALLSFAVLSRMVFADVGFSGGFKVDQSVNDFGGTATSASFQSVTTGGQFVTGESTSSNFQLSTGYQYSDSFAPVSKRWRWYDDEENETPTNPLESEDVAPSTVPNHDALKLRITVKETADIGQANTKFRLQYSTGTDFHDVHDLTEQVACTGVSVWCYADGAGADNAVISTKVLSDADTCSGGVGDGCGTHNESGTSTSSFTHKKSTSVEYEFTVISHTTAANTVYFFRLYDPAASSAVPLDTGESYPSLSAESGSLTFTVSGLPSGTSTAGVITDVDTSSTGVPFGTLPIGSAVTAAQRLEVSTNASTGFEVFTLDSQNLTGPSGQEVVPFTGTNAAPASWSSGCTSSNAGCFGYHTDAPVLSGDPMHSIRFAADDTYAGFAASPGEVAYSAIPASNHITDVVYKIEAHDLQAAGDYTTNLTYIVVPVF